MNIQEKYHENIGFYKDILPDGFCTHAIKEFDILEKNGITRSRQQSDNTSKTKKESQSYKYVFHLDLNTLLFNMYRVRE